MARSPRSMTHPRQGLGERWREFEHEPCSLCGSYGHSTTHCKDFDQEPATPAPYVPCAVPVRVLPSGWSLRTHGEPPERPAAVERRQRWQFIESGRVYIVSVIRSGVATLRIASTDSYVRVPCAKLLAAQTRWVFVGVER